MNKYIAILLVSIITGCNLKSKQAEEVKPKYTADWESLKQFEVPEWYKDVKFGIYFHWGPYSVPAHETEWYSMRMYQKDSPIRKYHEDTYGDLKEFGYKDFIPMFTAEKFNADEWAKLFKDAGAQFAGPVAEHADGFAMWDSELTKWDAKDMGPKRDIVGEMAKAVRKQNMKFIATYHRHWLYAWYPTWDENTDAGDPQYEGLYGPYVPEGSFVMATGDYPNPPKEAFNQEWLDRLNELMDKYEPDIIWFDNKMDIIGEEYRKQFLANYYNNGEKWGKEVVCTYKFHDMAEGSAVLDLERSRMSEKKDFTWLTDDSIDWKAWCDISDPKYKSTNRLIDFLVDVVSKNGAVLLNVTPRANGEIPEGVKTRLLEMGDWFNVNKEAIYGTRTWKAYGEGPQEIVEGHLSEDKNADAVAEDIRFTSKDGNLYAIALAWPGEKMLVRSFAKSKGLLDSEIKNVSMLGSSETLTWKMTDAGLLVDLPAERPCDHAFSLKIELK
ncbi:alpha-L-fucosidase [Labilibaculum antarcticum]|uniref:alpha-L-fucosidase n=1 Tax=Labilibaculum antarcticum TaxID=1717717 RepID=A0A1Y1CDN1_9BACT|nr:alpha-L-fucosidase [Labilibaculum antarcticum]BAX78456.1 alpha-L-fucosidase [Labilibaculum antarcticum]